MIAILIIILVLFLVLIGWMWNSLGTIEKKMKVACIIIGFVIVYMITFITYNISKIGITYEDRSVMEVVRNVYVFLFTIVNGYILLPYVFKKLEQVNNDEIERQILIRSIIIILIIIVILAIFEIRYLGKMQQGIINIINK